MGRRIIAIMAIFAAASLYSSVAVFAGDSIIYHYSAEYNNGKSITFNDGLFSTALAPSDPTFLPTIRAYIAKKAMVSKKEIPTKKVKIFSLTVLGKGVVNTPSTH